MRILTCRAGQGMLAGACTCRPNIQEQTPLTFSAGSTCGNFTILHLQACPMQVMVRNAHAHAAWRHTCQVGVSVSSLPVVLIGLSPCHDHPYSLQDRPAGARLLHIASRCQHWCLPKADDDLKHVRMCMHPAAVGSLRMYGLTAPCATPLRPTGASPGDAQGVQESSVHCTYNFYYYYSHTV